MTVLASTGDSTERSEKGVSQQSLERDAHGYQIATIPGQEQVNAAGYKDQLRRQYGLLGIVGIALTVDNAWAALGSSISVSICKFESLIPKYHNS